MTEKKKTEKEMASWPSEAMQKNALHGQPGHFQGA